jgi:hypothetical protein
MVFRSLRLAHQDIRHLRKPQAQMTNRRRRGTGGRRVGVSMSGGQRVKGSDRAAAPFPTCIRSRRQSSAAVTRCARARLRPGRSPPPIISPRQCPWPPTAGGCRHHGADRRGVGGGHLRCRGDPGAVAGTPLARRTALEDRWRECFGPRNANQLRAGEPSARIIRASGGAADPGAGGRAPSRVRGPHGKVPPRRSGEHPSRSAGH